MTREDLGPPEPRRSGEARETAAAPLPHVIAWNLTKRCNLACAHCYIAAGSWQTASGELSTTECHDIVEAILSVNPSPMLVLSGGEPLLRDDLEEIAAHASRGGATVVVGTNGTRLTDARIDSLMKAGVSGVAVSVDSLNPRYHDRFRHGAGALEETVEAVARLREHRLDCVIQTSLTRGNREEVRSLAAWASEAGAVAFNLYFVVSTGRGEGMSGLSPAENEEVLRELMELEREYRGRMMVRSKCQPQIMRHAMETDPESPLLRYGTRCPCGVYYCRITPEGKITPCPYMSVVAGDLRQHDFGRIWRSSPVFAALREGTLGGRCGRCEYRELCGGCRARAFAESGDYLGPDDSCLYEPSGEIPLLRPKGALIYGESGVGERSAAGPPPDGADRDRPLRWTPEAEERLRCVPSFVRGVVTARMENYAREHGYAEIDLALMAQVRRSLPVDYSKRLPFFLAGEKESP